jgi:hypothetical protein
VVIRILCLVLSALVSTASALEAQRDLLGFFPVASARAARPFGQTGLTVVCQAELKGAAVPGPYRGLWLSLLGDQPGVIRLAAFTRAKIRDPRQVISLSMRYAPLPTAMPGPAGTLDWGYVYDRNGDGRVDYLAYLQNAHPVLPDPVPADFPAAERNPDGSIRATKALLYAMIELGQMVFRHFADDDFDGRVDGMVVEEFDRERPMFVRDWLVYRAGTPGAGIDQAWAFRNSIRDTIRVLQRNETGYLMPSIDPDAPWTPVGQYLDLVTERIGVINGAVARCGVPVQGGAAEQRSSGAGEQGSSGAGEQRSRGAAATRGAHGAAGR